jgi:hypothetical protein
MFRTSYPPLLSPSNKFYKEILDYLSKVDLTVEFYLEWKRPLGLFLVVITIDDDGYDDDDDDDDDDDENSGDEECKHDLYKVRMKVFLLECHLSGLLQTDSFLSS